ncbi:MAG TPA: class I SAM-dependent methyltransferase [bacterium]
MGAPEHSPQNYFGAGRSSTYDRKIRASLPGYEALHAMVDDLLRQALPAQARLLIVGAGTGMELVTLGEAHPGWSFTATDLSAEMLAIGRANVEAAGLADRVRFHLGPVQDLPPDEAYDAATSILISHFIRAREERGRFFGAIAARLRPGAPLVTAELVGDRQDAGCAHLLEAWKGHYAAAGIPPREVEEDFARTDATVSFIPEAALLALLAGSGFADVRRFFQAFLFGGWVACRA